NLLFHPGLLTREYVAGRIVRYVAPFRLYLVSSLIFFLVLTLLADPAELGAKLDRCVPPGTVRADTTVAFCEPGGQREPARYVDFGPLADSARAAAWWKPAAHRLALQQARMNGMTKGQLVHGLVAGLERNAPTAVFLLLPIYAAFLKVLYLRRGRLYVEHFVFALHIHAFTLLVLAVLLLVPWPALSLLLFLWLPIYAFIAMRRMYGQGVLKTGAKFLVLGTSYVFAFLMALIATLTVAAMTV
ncbi:MAG TPA: DUF3667 domain-containing protein, partial [Longimicrobium sp.]